MKMIDPDTLLAKITASNLGRGFMLSTVIHVVVIVVTSVSLFLAWLGPKSDPPNPEIDVALFDKPSTINAKKKKADKLKAEAERKAAADQKALEQAQAQDAADEAAKKNAEAKGNSVQEKVAAAEAAAKGGSEPRKTPLDEEVEAPPKSFDIDGIDL